VSSTNVPCLSPGVSLDRVVFLSVFALSALTMVWLLWHHPIKTSIATIAVSAALGVSARSARSIEVESASELGGGQAP
jgi:hypothetical protein